MRRIWLVCFAIACVSACSDDGSPRDLDPENPDTPLNPDPKDPVADPIVVRIAFGGPGGGTVAVSRTDAPNTKTVCSGECEFAVERGEALELEASPDASSSLLQWGGACQESRFAARCSVVADAELDISLTLDVAGGVRWDVSGAVEYRGAVREVAVGPDDSVYAIGYYSGTLTMGSHELSGGNQFMARLSPEGEVQWLRALDFGSRDSHRIAVSDDGVVLMSATYSGTIEVGDDAYTADFASCVLAGIDAVTGAVLWSHTSESDSHSLSCGGVDFADGKFRVAGRWRLRTEVPGSLSFGGVSSFPPGGAFLLTASSTGVDDLRVIAEYPVAEGGMTVNNLVVQGGIAYVLGTHTAPVRSTTGSGNVSESNRGLFLLALELDTVSQHFAQFVPLAGSTFPRLREMAVDPTLGIVVMGDFGESFGKPGEHSITLGDTELVSAGQWDGFVARFDMTGAVQKVFRFGGPGAEFPGLLGMSPRGELVSIILSDTDVNLEGPVGEPGSVRTRIAVHTADDTLRWSQIMAPITTDDGARNGSVTAGAIDSLGRIIAGGAVIRGGPLDPLLVQLSP